MQVHLRRKDGGAIFTPLQLKPVRYSAAALGGPETATIEAQGNAAALLDALTWLAAEVMITNEAGQPVWWGVVNTIQVRTGGIEYGLDGSEIVNRMAVVYAGEGDAPASTAWVEDARSIATYGRREYREGANVENAATALAKATRFVNEKASPLQSAQAGAGADGATLECVGYWATLGWRYWVQPGGQEMAEDQATVGELLGWSLTDDDFGFNFNLIKVCRFTPSLHVLVAGDRVEVSGSTSNDGVYEVAETEDRLAQTALAGTDIYFDETDDVHQGAGLLNAFREGDLLEIDGSSLNDGTYFVKDWFRNGDGAYDHLRVYPNSIVDESAGASVTLTAGVQIGVVQRPAAMELPGATVTVKSQAVQVAMPFTVAADAGWELSEVWIQAATVGAPADGLQVAIHADSSGAPAATALKSATVAGGDLPAALDWVMWSFDSAQVLASATTYWVVVSRTGSAGAAAYRVGLVEVESASDNALLWDGASWGARSVASGLESWMPFRVIGQRITTTQIADVVDGVGDWLDGCLIEQASGLRARLHRSEEQAQTALAEVQALLGFGTAAGARLLAQVSAEKLLTVRAAPTRSSPALKWTAEGLRDRFGLALALGMLPVGEWVAFDVLGATGQFAPAFLEGAEFDCTTLTVRPRWRSERAVSALARLAQDRLAPDLAARLAPFLRS